MWTLPRPGCRLGFPPFALTQQNGCRPLHVAALSNAAQVARVLLQHGADVHATTLAQSSSPLLPAGASQPLHFAAETNSLEATRALVGAGAQLDAATSDGSTPLHRCAEYGSREVAALFLRKGAQPTLSNKAGRTPVDVACSNAMKATLQRRHGAAAAAERGRPQRGAGSPAGAPRRPTDQPAMQPRRRCCRRQSHARCGKSKAVLGDLSIASPLSLSLCLSPSSHRYNGAAALPNPLLSQPGLRPLPPHPPNLSQNGPTHHEAVLVGVESGGFRTVG